MRFYEEKGLISPVRRNTRRYYTASDRAKLQTIVTGRAMGFGLAELSELVSPTASDHHGQASFPRAKIEDKIRAHERQIKELQRAIQSLRLLLTAG